MYQNLIIVGNLGRDPEMRYTPSGQAVTTFSVATSRKYTGSNGELVNETVWFRVTTWGKSAETCNQYLKKGSKVLVEGRLTADPATGGPRVFTTQQGQTKSSYEVTANQVRFMSGPNDSVGDAHGGGGSRPAESTSGFIGAPDDDEIPF